MKIMPIRIITMPMTKVSFLIFVTTSYYSEQELGFKIFLVKQSIKIPKKCKKVIAEPRELIRIVKENECKKRGIN
jgi:hypothetical protein